MKPKISSGYLTPQSNRIRKETQNAQPPELNEFNEELYQKLISDPVKRKLILQLITQERGAIEEYKKQEEKKKLAQSPLNKLQKKYKCESPTELMRRRQLHQQARDNESDSNSEKSVSAGSSRSSTPNPSPIPFAKLLDGVTAYVEIKSKDQDRSAGAKALLKTMGAKVRDQFSRDVTHVVFKDGSYTTYQKAKLIKVHFVSVLWLEAVRKNNYRVPEKDYPALGRIGFDHDVSSVCSQLQKEYEDVIREEMRRSLATGSPLPSTKTLIERRRTLMTPANSSSFSRSRDSPILSRSSQDNEVERINRRQTMDYSGLRPPSAVLETVSPELTSDDDSEVGIINGQKADKSEVNIDSFIDTSTDLSDNLLSYYKKKKKRLETSDMELTTAHDHPITGRECLKEIDITANKSDMDLTDIPSFSNVSSKRRSRATASKENTPVDVYKRRTVLLEENTSKITTSSDKSTNISYDKNKTSSSNTTTSNLLLNPPGIEILSKNCGSPLQAVAGAIKNDSMTTMSSLRLSSDNDRNSSKGTISTKTDMSALKISSENVFKVNSTSTNMSSLKITNDSIEIRKKSDDLKQVSVVNSTDTNLSSLRLSSTASPNDSANSSEIDYRRLSKRKSTLAKTPHNESGKSEVSSKLSFSPVDVTKAIKIVDDNITKRRKTGPLEVSDQPANKSNRQSRRMTKANNELKTAAASPSNSDNKVEPETKSRRKSMRVAKLKDDHDKKSTTEEEAKTGADAKTKRKESSRRLANNLTQQTNPPNETTTKKVSSNSKTSPDRKDKSISTESEESSTDSVGKKTKRLRKLYNPDDSYSEYFSVSDEKERKENRLLVKKRKSDECFVIPLAVASVDSSSVEEGEILKALDLIKPTKPKKKKEADEVVNRNSDADEQKDLALEFVNKTPKGKSKKLESKSENVLIAKRKSTRQLTENKNSQDGASFVCPITPSRNRRSTLEFQSVSQSSRRRLKIDSNKEPTIVCTKMHRHEVETFEGIVKKLGRFKTEKEVTRNTTHLVVGEPKRTINMLRAIAIGCWILKKEWLYASMEARKWLPEEDYEETDFSPAVQQCRLQRHAFGPSYSMDIFQNSGKIYISKSSTPRCSDLRELVEMCKGRIVLKPEQADIIVGEYSNQENTRCVTEIWILDSITMNKCKSLKKYLIPMRSQSPIV